ncbi:hypothetical protein BDD43_4172 [Mucilaginibacter gracilis]|uniref:Uncharacterized protein n=1 Tax=Mucilaginibacter gracilis TaxID=423350 RepID=A0A495J4S4_9SPHI|nr:hypothetical protein [Mucilaginibacter gracilis]RKR83957.1 hypothetical protein BDD43_4172 [Mucilaginibacter gracilis]
MKILKDGIDKNDMTAFTLLILFLSPAIIQAILTLLRINNRIRLSIGKIAIIATILNIFWIAALSYYQRKPNYITHQPPDALTGFVLILYGVAVSTIVIPIVGMAGFLIWNYKKRR